jgi:hypothetical protein
VAFGEIKRGHLVPERQRRHAVTRLMKAKAKSSGAI